jgi:hypothetical protein
MLDWHPTVPVTAFFLNSIEIVLIILGSGSHNGCPSASEGIGSKTPQLSKSLDAQVH